MDFGVKWKWQGDKDYNRKLYEQNWTNTRYEQVKIDRDSG